MALRIIHVGLGGWGGNWARTVIPAVAEVELVAAVDPHEPTRAAVTEDVGFPASIGFASLTEALDAVDADAVVITSPAVTHVPLALEALDRGLHVLVEKPFANAVEEALVATRRAEERGLVLQVSQNYRFFPAPRAVRSLLAQKAIGEVSAISIDFRRWDNDLPKGAHPHYAFPHPMINDMAIHHFDLLRMITGQEAVSVFAKTSDPSFSKYDEEASAVFIIELESGVLVSYRGSWLSRGRPTAWAGEWRIDGEEGELSFTSRADGPNNIDGDRVSILRAGEDEATDVELEEMDLVERAAGLRAFAASVSGGPAPESSGRDNLGSLALMEAAARSAATGRVEEVRIP